LLTGIALEARAEVALASRSLGEAVCVARAARRVYATQRAAWHEARATLLLARVAYAARHPAALHRRLHALARIDAASAYRFATAWAAVSALQVGARSLDPTIRAVRRAHLAYAEGRAIAPSPTPETTARPGALRVVDRSGSRVVGARAAAQLRASELDGLLDLERGELLTPTGRYALGTRRVLVPLLVTLVGAGDAAVDAEVLHREVWGVDRFDAVAQTRLKVAVSRARSLLGAGAIETTRARSPGGVAITCYRLAPTLAFAVIARS